MIFSPMSFYISGSASIRKPGKIPKVAMIT